MERTDNFWFSVKYVIRRDLSDILWNLINGMKFTKKEALQIILEELTHATYAHCADEGIASGILQDSEIAGRLAYRANPNEQIILRNMKREIPHADT